MRDSTSIAGRESALKNTLPDAGETPASLTNLRWYKGLYPVRILIKGTRKTHRGPITYLVEALDDVPLGSLSYPNSNGVWSSIVLQGNHFTTIPRLLWRKPK